MKKENFTDSDPDVAYEGFCIDLLNGLRAKLQFEYELQLREEFGERQPDGSWNGMIGELTRKVNRKKFQETEVKQLCFNNGLDSKNCGAVSVA